MQSNTLIQLLHQITYIALLLQWSGVNDVRKVIGVNVWTPSKLHEYVESLHITNDYFWSVNYVLPTVSLLVFFPVVMVLLFIVSLNIIYCLQTTCFIYPHTQETNPTCFNYFYNHLHNLQ